MFDAEPAHMVFGIIAGLSTLALGVIGFFLRRLLSGVDGLALEVKALRDSFAEAKTDLAVLRAELARTGTDLVSLRAHVDAELSRLQGRMDEVDRRKRTR